MGKSNKAKRSLMSRLRNKYRLVLMHDKTFEVQTSIKLSMFNVIVILSTLFVVVSLLVYSAIAFTPLKNFVVGFSEAATARQVLRNNSETDSILQALKAYDLYFANLQKRINGEIDSLQPIENYKKEDFVNLTIDSASALDQKFRQQVEQEDLFNLTSIDAEETGAENFRSIYFFPPVKGTITSAYNDKNKHFGVDVVAPENTAIKACLGGTVIDAYWSVEAGNVIVLQHDYGLISLYKHNSQLLKKIGNFVRAGDVIAIIGNSGELSSGPHLHFELWHNKFPVNPSDFVIFN